MTSSLPGSIRSPQWEPAVVTCLETLFLLLRKAVIEGRGARTAASPSAAPSEAPLSSRRGRLSGLHSLPASELHVTAQDTAKPVEVPVRAHRLPSVSWSGGPMAEGGVARVVSSPGVRGSVPGWQGREHNIVAKVLGALREVMERAKEPQRCRGVFSGSMSIASGAGDEGRFLGAGSVLRVGPAGRAWPCRSRAPGWRGRQKTWAPCRPCVRANAGGRAGAKPPSPGQRSVTCTLHGRLRNTQEGGMAQDPSWRGTWKGSPSPPLHPRPAPDRGWSGVCFQRDPSASGGHLGAADACLPFRLWEELV